MFNLTKKQQEIIDNNARIKLVMGANRSGKTITAILNMWAQMKKENNPSFKGIYLITSMSVLKMVVRQITAIIPTQNILSVISKKEDYSIVSTTYGEIYVSTRFIDLDFENKTIDEASGNKYVDSTEFWEGSIDSNFYISGHFPKDINNAFFKLWLKGHFSQNQNMQSFRITDTNSDISDPKNREALIKYMGEQRFNREYLAIPDYFELKSLLNSDK